MDTRCTIIPLRKPHRKPSISRSIRLLRLCSRQNSPILTKGPRDTHCHRPIFRVSGIAIDFFMPEAESQAAIGGWSGHRPEGCILTETIDDFELAGVVHCQFSVMDWDDGERWDG